MADDTEDPQLRRVRKLLAHAEDETLTPEARAAYNARAAELIAAYGVDAAMLAEARPGRDEPVQVRIVPEAPYAAGKGRLLCAVALPLRCRVVKQTRSPAGQRRTVFHVFGMRSDVRRAELLYTSLLVQVAHELAVARPPYGESRSTYRHSWLAGYVTTVYRRLDEAERAAEAKADRRRRETGAAGRSTALVLADRSALVDAAMAAAFGKLRKGRRWAAVRGSGGPAGRAAGERADLGTGNRVGGTGRAAITG